MCTSGIRYVRGRAPLLSASSSRPYQNSIGYTDLVRMLRELDFRPEISRGQCGRDVFVAGPLIRDMALGNKLPHPVSASEHLR
jgi:hypothetical protein